MKTLLPEKIITRQRKAAWFIHALCCVAVVGLIVFGPIAQDTRYHQFADQRELLGIANFWNVVSNLPFLLIGIVGLLRCKKLYGLHLLSGNRGFYSLFFLGITLTGITSSYYHLQPDNIGLFWDRVTMALCFAGLIGIVIGEFISHNLAQKLKIPLVVFGLLSVVYWIISEFLGAGDLRPYILTQFLPMLIIPLIAFFWKSTVIRKIDVVIIAIAYGVAKLFELCDVQLYQLIGLSGHTLKHLAAAYCAIWIYRILSRVKKI